MVTATAAHTDLEDGGRVQQVGDAEPLGVVVLNGLNHHLVEVVVRVLQPPALKVHQQRALLHAGTHPAARPSPQVSNHSRLS